MGPPRKRCSCYDIAVIWTAWKNGKHNYTGVGYGFRISPADRDKYFRHSWGSVFLDAPRWAAPMEVSISNESFWGRCCELRSKEIGVWLWQEKHSPWPTGNPPEFEIKFLGQQRFRILRRV
jgi:hypothetical protein